MTRVALLLGAASAVAALAGCMGGDSDRVGGDSPTEVRTLTILDPTGSGFELSGFNDEVERLSHGSLRMRVVNGHLGGTDYEEAGIRAVRNGDADLSIAGTRVWDAFGIERLRAFGAPLLIDSLRLQERVLASDFVAPMLEDLRPLGLVGIGIIPGPIRRPFGVSQRFVAPADFRGATIGTQESGVADATMRALGATPRRLPSEGRADVDGYERAVVSIESDPLDVPGSHLTTNVNLWPRPLVIYAGERAYRDLTDEQREILRKAAAGAVPKKTAFEHGVEAETASNLCRKGLASFDSARPAQLRKFRRAVEPVYRDLERDPGTRAAIRAIENLKRQLVAPPTAIPACTAGTKGPASRGATKLDGVWTMDTRRSAARPEYFPENWGHWVYVFDRGRFGFTQENEAEGACTWGYGKFKVRGNRTSWLFSDGGGIAPAGAMDRPGEFFVFDFSRYRDTLTLTPVKGEISPRNFRDKPWRLSSETPSRRYFSRRCPPPAAALRE